MNDELEITVCGQAYTIGITRQGDSPDIKSLVITRIVGRGRFVVEVEVSSGMNIGDVAADTRSVIHADAAQLLAVRPEATRHITQEVTQWLATRLVCTDRHIESSGVALADMDAALGS